MAATVELTVAAVVFSATTTEIITSFPLIIPKSESEVDDFAKK